MEWTKTMTNDLKDLKDKLEFYQKIGWWWKEAELVGEAMKGFSPTRVKTGIKEGLCPVCRNPYLRKEDTKYIHRDYGEGAYMYHVERSLED